MTIPAASSPRHPSMNAHCSRTDMLAKLKASGNDAFRAEHQGHLFWVLTHLRESNDEQAFATLDVKKVMSQATNEPTIVDLLKFGRLLPLAKITIGRTSNNDVVLADSSVSKFHAYVKITRELGFEFVDVGSTNGTKVNGFTLKAKEGVEIAAGDTLIFGSAFEAKTMSANTLVEYLSISQRLGF